MENRNYFTERDVERLETQAVQIRQDIISMIHSAKAGHPGGSLSAVEMVTALYFHVMNIKPEEPQWADRDRFILQRPLLPGAVRIAGAPGILRPRTPEHPASVSLHSPGAPGYE